MSALVFGVGVGLFLLIALWVTAFLLCIVSLRAQKNVGFVAFLSAVLFTTVLLLLPIDSPSETKEAAPTSTPKIYDRFFIWRILLTVFLLLVVVGGCVNFVYSHLMEPQLAKPLERHARVE